MQKLANGSSFRSVVLPPAQQWNKIELVRHHSLAGQPLRSYRTIVN